MLTSPRAQLATVAACICIAGSIFVTPMPAHSQWIENGAPVCTAPYVQEDPAIVSDGAGGAIIVWSHINAQRDIFAQRIDGDGIVLWTVNGVAVCAASAEQFDPAIASDGAGGAIIVWEDNRTPYTIIFAQRIDADGNPLWLADGIPVCSGPAMQINPSIVSDGAGGAVVTWQDSRNDGEYEVVSDVYTQRLDANGGYMWDSNGVPVSTLQHMYERVNLLLAPDGTGGAFFLWMNTYYDAWPGIQFARVDDSGVLRWRSAVSASPEVAYYTAATIAPCFGGALLVWGEWDGHEIIYTNKIDTSGAELWRYPEYMWPLRYRKIATSSFSQSSAQVITDGSEGAIVTWCENNGLFARRLDADGDTLWTPYANPVCSVGAGKGYIQLVGNGSGGAIITWQERRGSDLDIYAQIIDSNGIIKGPVEGILLCSAVRDQIEPCITGNGAGGALIAWEDDRPDWFSDIYAHQVEFDGTVETELLSWSVSPEGTVVKIAWTLNNVESDTELTLCRIDQRSNMTAEIEGALIHRMESEFTAVDIDAEPGRTYIYRLTVEDSSGERILFESDPVSIPALPVTLFQNSPNPFNPSTTIRYFLPEGARVSIEIFDVSGRLVEVIANGEKGSGYHEMTWSAPSRASGIYFCLLRAGKVSISRKMVLLR